MAVLVAGGCGYIGSHTCLEFLEQGYDVVAADNLCNSSAESLRRVEELTGKKIPFYEVNVCDRAAVRPIFENHKIDCVIQFAGLKAVGESVQKPLEYYQNNLNATLTLCDVMREFGVKRMIFSSSATVYGLDNPIPYVETMPTGECTNPYGWTKVMSEKILQGVAAADPEWSVVLLRYFNPIGAHESGRIGENPNGVPNNLMPYITQVAVGRREKLEHLRSGLPHPGRHLHPGLHPCGGSGQGPCGRHGVRHAPHRHRDLQSGHRQRRQRHRTGGDLRAGQRRRRAPRLCGPPGGRSGRILCQCRQGQARAGLAGRAEHRRHVPGQLELAEEQSERLFK